MVKTTPSPFQNRINYVLEFISQHPLLRDLIQFTSKDSSDFDILISYGTQESKSFFIPAQRLFFSNDIPSYRDLVPNKYNFESMSLYSVALPKASQVKDFFFENNFRFDILETIFFHISRVEEWNCIDQDLDQWGMMHSQKQFLVKHQLHQIPVVDHLILAFAKAIGLSIPPQKTKLRITHDIDEVQWTPSLYKTLRASGGIIWKRQILSALPRVWSASFSSQNAYNTFNWMLTDNSTIEKCIYFLVDGITQYDTPYNLGTASMQTIFQMCKARNYTIGIHPSYNCWRDEKMFKKERTKLEKAIKIPVNISRQHYLHFDFKTTPKILDQQKIKEDSTMGFNDRIGFRCGTGFGYHLYDFENEKPFNFLETPLVFMDSSLFKETNYDLKKTTQLWTSFLAKNEFHTKITFNFHNSRFYDASIHGIPLKEWYQELLTPDLDLDKTKKL